MEDAIKQILTELKDIRSRLDAVEPRINAIYGAIFREDDDAGAGESARIAEESPAAAEMDPYMQSLQNMLGAADFTFGFGDQLDAQIDYLNAIAEEDDADAAGDAPENLSREELMQRQLEEMRKFTGLENLTIASLDGDPLAGGLTDFFAGGDLFGPDSEQTD